MTEQAINYPLVILVTGGLLLLIMLAKAALERTRFPPMVGYLFLGFLLTLADGQWGFLGFGCREILGFLGKVGLVTLLFRVGLESNLGGLLQQIRRASAVWMCDVLGSGLVGFVTAYWLLELSWITSLIVATALTATSVGVSVAVWEEEGALQSPNGELLIDVAEMDDISAVVLMAVLFALLPDFRQETGAGNLWPLLPKTAGLFLLKILIFGGLCLVFSRFGERPLTGFFTKFESVPDPMLVIVAVGFIIASLAALLGFSLAIGTFFAGLVFSRDPAAVKMESSFIPLYDLFSPFFFVGIGLDLDPGSLSGAAGLGLILCAAAILGKFAADGLPVWRMAGLEGGVLIGASMVPRAEIAMVVMQKGLNLGEWAVPPRVFGGMVLVSAVTCMLSPLTVHRLLRKWPQRKGAP